MGWFDIKEITELFNSREIASGIWIAIFFGWALFSKSVRKSIWGVIKMLFSRTIFLSLLLTGSYLGFFAWLASNQIDWDFSFTKSTILWAMFGGYSLIMKLTTEHLSEFPLKSLLLEQVKFAVIIEFIVNLHTFSLLFELISIPLITIMVVITAFSEGKPEYAPSTKILNFILGLYGLFLVLLSTKHLIFSSDELNISASIIGFILPFYFLIIFLPYLYLELVYSYYNTLFIRIKIGPEKSKRIQWRIKLNIFRFCTIRLSRLARVANMTLFNIMSVTDDKDLEQMISVYSNVFNGKQRNT